MFDVDDSTMSSQRLASRGGQLLGEIVHYEDAYRLCYLRGPEGIIIALAQDIG